MEKYRILFHFNPSPGIDDKILNNIRTVLEDLTDEEFNIDEFIYYSDVKLEFKRFNDESKMKN